MTLAVFDIGGSAVKYGKWENQTLSETGQFKTPETLTAMQDEMKAVIAHSCIRLFFHHTKNKQHRRTQHH